MKKVFSIIKIIIIVVFIILAIYVFLDTKKIKTTVFDVNIDKYASIDELYFYGTHFNINGYIDDNINDIKKVELIISSLDNKYEYKYNLNYHIDDKIYFDTNNYINEGLYLDDLKVNSYRIKIYVESNNRISSYNIKNNTIYKNTKYYSLNNTIINLNTNNDILDITVDKNKEDTYDIIIDPGHGGKDPGACYNSVCEIDYTLMLSNILKTKLEKLGYKVALTRDKDMTLDKYGDDNRIARVHKSHSKFALSIHLNSTYQRLDGFEIYASNNTNLYFPRQTISLLKEVKGLNVSNNTHFKVEDGIYVRTFSSSDVNSANEDGVYPNVNTNTNYYFMIRETGGYITGAYVDGREGEGENKFRNSNVGVETFILELGYINNPDNVEEIKKNKDKYMDKVSISIDKYLKKKA